MNKNMGVMLKFEFLSVNIDHSKELNPT